jgi:hypothetical protein
LLHGPSTRPPRRKYPVAEPVPAGKVSLVKAPHDPYELFRDSLDEAAADVHPIDDEFDDEFEAELDDEQVIDLTEDTLEEDPEVGSEVDHLEGEFEDGYGDHYQVDDLDMYAETEDPVDAVDRPAVSSKTRRIHLPNRLRRKPKVIRLPD